MAGIRRLLITGMQKKSRQGLHIFKEVAIISLLRAAVAQLDRVLGYEPRGRGFESCQPRHFFKKAFQSEGLFALCHTDGYRTAREAVQQQPLALAVCREQPGCTNSRYASIVTAVTLDAHSTIVPMVAVVGRPLTANPDHIGIGPSTPDHIRQMDPVTDLN